MKTKKIVIALLVILVFICGFSAGYFALFSSKNDTLRSYDDKYQEYAKQKDELILSDYSNDENSDDIAEYTELANKYTSALSDLNEAFKSKDVEGCKQADSDLSSIVKNLKIKDESILNAKSDEIERVKQNLDNTQITISSVKNNSINNIITEFNKLFKTYKYNSAYSKYKEIISSINYNKLKILRYDIHQYPTVRAYIDIDDIIDNALLNSSNFRVVEKIGDNKEKEIPFEYKTSTNGNLYIDLLADVSYSMENKIPAVKEASKNFVTNVTSDENKVGLVSFSNSFNRMSFIDYTTGGEYNFTNNTNQITSKIDELSVEPGTRLYDSLYMSVNETRKQDGSKCIVVFTDGWDNNSFATKEDVQEIANKYKIPIYTIGIFDESLFAQYLYSNEIQSEIEECRNNLKNISANTGGKYYEMSEYATDISSGMEKIYKDIYLQNQKSIYLEFEDIKDKNSQSEFYIKYFDTENNNQASNVTLTVPSKDKNNTDTENYVNKIEVANFVAKSNMLYFDVISNDKCTDPAKVTELKKMYTKYAKDNEGCSSEDNIDEHIKDKYSYVYGNYEITDVKLDNNDPNKYIVTYIQDFIKYIEYNDGTSKYMVYKNYIGYDTVIRDIDHKLKISYTDDRIKDKNSGIKYNDGPYEFNNAVDAQNALNANVRY